ncbi:hypothetical protein G6F46_008230 [Rhizopus delemar]|uniref:DDHD domain-containing protein n=2 Tax=Rhizopus TaxID=4842 RepID=A0A9P7CMM4_9FUNG|nr:hypothetical protein G6F55_007130 [Rhizopus delemar]KAG1540453.1 hypothetical protein G6F51_008515 [Rhizopus arrhizus]KAG1498226.1 hypothetical protein G6F54_005226 [Rhizopus delemar]KAG1511880.1 hypothetical protein G6F53_005605 [Rhizopus delemar]KAG1523836.1 hypothetical protein G6F52_004688 [Rhizopus delemar]
MLGSSYLYHTYKQVNTVENTVLTSPIVEGSVDHVVFVIHVGIGQVRKIFQSLFDTTNEAVEINCPGTKVNIQYIPIEWHMHIHQETDAVMNQITPRSIPALRLLNNDYLADAFFYLSNDRGQSIINHVTDEFNQSYSNFMKLNPEFKGKIAIVAYSLGGIITWDILSNQAHSNLSQEDIKKVSRLDLTFPKLNFKPDYLFTLGSPLSAFLIVRNQDPNLYHPDPSIQFENIFHPFDPLGYRFEPLLTAGYKDTPAVLVDRCSSNTTNFASSLMSSATVFVNHITNHNIWSIGRNLVSSLLKGDCRLKEDLHCSDENNTPKLSLDESIMSDEEECRTPPPTEEKHFTYKRPRSISFSSDHTSKKLCALSNPSDQALLNTTLTRNSSLLCYQSPIDETLIRRVDYVLQPEKFLGIMDKNPYLCGLTAHFSYWSHKDLLWHIVRRLES